MKENEILTMLKTDLGISSSAYDSYLTKIIKLSTAAIQKEGIIFLLDEESRYSVEDGMLIQMYSAYLYRKRREEVAAMPRSLRYALNNRLFSQKGVTNNG